MKKLILKEDLIVPAGTEFFRGPNMTAYAGDNYEALIEMTPYNTAEVILYLDEDLKDFVEVIEE